jgi:dephospho-CoA kinase
MPGTRRPGPEGPKTVVLGLTGGIGSGKSTVGAMLVELGAVLVDADAIVHELQAPGSPMLKEIAEAFGPEVIGPDGALDRKALAAVVFADPDARARLGHIVHPPTIAEMGRRMRAAQEQGVPVVVLDIPLLLEGRQRGTGSGALLPFDAVVVAWVPEEVQIARAAARDDATREEVEARVRAQLSLDEKREMADYVIDNSGSLEETRAQVKALWESLTRDAEAP